MSNRAKRKQNLNRGRAATKRVAQKSGPSSLPNIDTQELEAAGTRTDPWLEKASDDVRPQAEAIMAPTVEEQRILRERTERLAREERRDASLADDDAYDYYIRFRLGSSEKYGIPSEFVEEIIRSKGLAKVPGTPGIIAGIVSWRGELLTVINLKHFFQTKGENYADENLIIVVNGAGMTLGVLINGVEDYVRFKTPGLWAAFPSEGVQNLEHVLGIDKQGNVTLLDMEALLADASLVVDQTRLGWTADKGSPAAEGTRT